MSEIVLFDLPSKGRCACWSPNTWKTRAALNYKKVPYKTEWVEYPDLKTKCQELNIPANPPGSFADYTVPFVKFPDGTYLMDSAKIVEKLEQLHPEPSLRLNPALEKEYGEISSKVIFPCASMLFRGVNDKINPDSSTDWFRKDREGRLGGTLEQLDEKNGGEVAWKNAQPGLKRFEALLKDHKEDSGPFVLGSKVSYVDLMAVGIVEFYRRIGEDLYERLIAEVQGLKELEEACKPYFKRDDH